MEKGLGDLGFWLAVGIVLAALIVAGAIKERAKERERQTTLRALLEMGSNNASEVLAYLREKDAAEAEAQRRKKKMSPRQEVAFAGAALVGMFSFFVGIMALATQHRPVVFPRFEYSAQAGRMIPVPPPPPPTGWDAFLPLAAPFAIWAAGLIIAALIVMWGGFGKETNGAQPDA